MRNKKFQIPRIALYAGIVFGFAAIIIMFIPAFISGDFVRQRVEQVLESRYHSDFRVGHIAFHWPNKFTISHLTIQGNNQNIGDRLECNNILGKVNFFPLLFKKFDAKKIYIEHITYGNWLSIKDLATKQFSFQNEVIFTDAHFILNDGNARIKGTLDLSVEKPLFDLFIDADGIHIPGNIPHIYQFSGFLIKDGEIGGILGLNGHMRGKGFGEDLLNEQLNADMHITVKRGYIKGNELISSVMRVIGAKDVYSFDSMNAKVNIAGGVIKTEQLDFESDAVSISASGVVDFKGKIACDAVLNFNEKQPKINREKASGDFLNIKSLPIEIRGTLQDPKIKMKLQKEQVSDIIMGMIKGLFSPPEQNKRKNPIYLK